MYFMFPEMIDRTCAKCERYWYQDGIGTMGPLMLLDGGDPMPRPKGGGTPCHQCPKVPTDAPARTREHAIEPTEKSLAALRHYERCAAVRRFPEGDEIVDRNAGLIAPIERAAEVAKQRDAASLIALLIASGGKRA